MSLIWIKIWNGGTKKDVHLQNVTDEGEVKTHTHTHTHTYTLAPTDARHSDIISLFSPLKNEGRLKISNSTYEQIGQRYT